jgi:hypothetical protein
LSKAVGKYKIKPDFLIHNTVDCNNNDDEINKDYKGMDYTDERMQKCVFGIKWMEACSQEYWGKEAEKNDLYKSLNLPTDFQRRCPTPICTGLTCAVPQCKPKLCGE